MFPPKCRSTRVNCMASRGFKEKKDFLKTLEPYLQQFGDQAPKKIMLANSINLIAGSARKVDPYSASLVQVASYLTDLFATGLQYRTIAG